MQVGDAVSGVFFILLACLVFWLTKDFRVMPGQNYGASFFPRTIAVCMGLMGLLLVLRGMCAHGAFRVTPGDWLRSGQHVVSFLLIVGVLVFYILMSDTLGFLITGFVSLLVLLLWLRGTAHWMQAVIVSVVCVLGMQLFFGEFLRVPLPWGILQPVAW